MKKGNPDNLRPYWEKCHDMKEAGGPDEYLDKIEETVREEQKEKDKEAFIKLLIIIGPIAATLCTAIGAGITGAYHKMKAKRAERIAELNHLTESNRELYLQSVATTVVPADENTTLEEKALEEHDEKVNESEEGKCK